MGGRAKLRGGSWRSEFHYDGLGVRTGLLTFY